ncbi:MAG: c-type cytochrome [Planctomycetota bacterium]|jgi:mono/diheme cytochrome c family protein
MMLKRITDKLQNFNPRWSPAMYRNALVSLLIMAIVIPLALVAVPFIEFLNGMAAQPKGKTQMTYGRLFDQQLPVDRLPVRGSIPRGYISPAFEDKPNTIEVAREVGRQLNNPVPINMANMRSGQKLYSIYCIVCHGQRGEGDGPVTGPDRFPAPPSLHTDQALNYKDGTIYHVITKGVGKMSGYSDKLDAQERWQVIHYLRALQRAMNPKPEDLKP